MHIIHRFVFLSLSVCLSPISSFKWRTFQVVAVLIIFSPSTTATYFIIITSDRPLIPSTYLDPVDDRHLPTPPPLHGTDDQLEQTDT